MGNVSKAIRTELAERYVLDWGQIVRDRTSSDGTRKWLLDFGGQQVESACAKTICVAMDASRDHSPIRAYH
jgi:adenine C2-methylase RlmN of 23S rRNA A2503 and tRNA A37